MKLQRLKNNDLMIIVPARQQSRWRLITGVALEVIETYPNQGYQDKRISEDLRTLRKELGCKYNI